MTPSPAEIALTARRDLKSVCRAYCHMDGVDPDRSRNGEPAWQFYAQEAGRAVEALFLIPAQPDLFGDPR